MPKINWLFPVWLLTIGVLIYSRFVNLGWGLPYGFHPDERNMAIAIQQLNWQEKFNPHFFAYGQFPLYLGYIISLLTKFGATLSLRIISAMASVLTSFMIFKTIMVYEKKISFLEKILTALLIIFSPYAIQFAHFGTTESLLMLFYSLIVYYSLKRNIFFLAISAGLAMATKVSSAIFLVLPIITIYASRERSESRSSRRARTIRIFTKIGTFIIGALFFFVLFSPHNFFNWQDFLASMAYESDVALGKMVVFYTRQFVDSIPVLFQFEKIFPYTLGFFQLVLFLLGFVFLSWRDKKINLLRLAFLIYFVPNAFIFAKWTRFMAPVFPVMTVFSILFVLRLRFARSLVVALLLLGMTGATVWPGIKYLSVYQKPDTRIAASDWIYKNIPENSYILSETANVIDIPMGGEKSYQVISFNFYELDNDATLQDELANHLAKADYIFVPSRRIFANHPKDKYPKLYKYYEDLNSGSLGFKKVAEFSTGLKDEGAEETWTVFDHPTIRIFKKVF